MIRFIVLFLALTTNVTLSTDLKAADYTGSRFNDVWSQVKSDPYSKLPYNKVTFKSLLKGRGKRAANRTISNRADLLPHFNKLDRPNKLAHPNGICLKGLWTITQANPYGGFFRKGSEALFLARASVAMSETEKGHYRAFGFAGKLFPTLDGEEIVKTANFFTVDDLGGTKAEHFTDVTLLNAPPITPNWTMFGSILYIMKLAGAFKAADSHATIRQVYEISELGEDDPTAVRTPKWMAIRAQEGQTVDKADFRDELNLINREGNLIFDIMVASEEDAEGNKNWQTIGMIKIDETVASKSGDQKLHFHHPKWKELNH